MRTSFPNDIMDNKIIVADICSYCRDGRNYGHYFPVAENYLQLFGMEATLIAGGPVYKQRFEDCLLQLPYNVNNTDSSSISKLHQIINSYNLFKKAKGQVIVMQSVCLISAYIGVLLFYHGGGKLYFIQYYTDSIKSKVGRFLYRLIKHKIDGIICPNDYVGNAFELPYCVVTDYINIRRSSPSIPYKDRKYDFGLVGKITKDKGVLEILEFLSCKGHSVIVAGSISDVELAKKIDKAAKKDSNIELHLEYISDNQYNYYIQQSRYCILNYQGTYNERSSGVVFDILFNGTPVIGKKCRALTLIEENSLGCLYDNCNDWIPGKMLSEQIFNEYTSSIIRYQEKQELLAKSLKQFISPN